jgi:hypothetical protein
MKMFCQIRQNALDGVRTWAQHAYAYIETIVP